MKGFSEDWLEEHQAKMARLNTLLNAPRAVTIAAPVVPATTNSDLIAFRLVKPFKLLNETIRMHWTARRQYQMKLARDISTSTTFSGPVMQRAKVQIVRWSVKDPDKDGLYGGAKHLIDCLLVKSPTHPFGLGFCVDDSPDRMEIEIKAEHAYKQIEQRTDVTITRIV